jgi:CMP-N,N'-diacetyllegionaminic acid synthase
VTDVIAIIPARGGSKGIPRKNIVDVAGRPLIDYSIEHAQRSKRITRVIVSTDDEEIAGVARKSGAEVPFLRPKDLAGDTVLDLPVFEHALRWLEESEGARPGIVVHLRPTAPLRPDGQIDAMIELLDRDQNADSVRSVSKPGPHPWRMFGIGADGYLHPFMNTGHKEPYLLRRQELPEVYWYNAVTDVTRRRTILEKHSMTGDRILPYIIDSRYVVDIDEPDDLLIAAVKLRQLQPKRVVS